LQRRQISNVIRARIESIVGHVQLLLGAEAAAVTMVYPPR
jgi:hypothetical protein